MNTTRWDSARKCRLEPWLALAIGALFAGCSGDDDAPCEGSLCEPPDCPAPGCPRGTIQLNPRAADGSLNGTYAPPTGGTAIEFSVASTGAGATATFQPTDGSGEVAVDLVDSDHAELTWNGTVLDGVGVLEAGEIAALEEISAREDLVAALAAAPLELGCLGGDLGPEEMAALVFPWQMLLKYQMPDRLDVAEVLGKGSSCAYFVDPVASDAEPWPPTNVPNLLLLSHEQPVPTVFGFFPFDELGAAEAEGGPGALSATGPCDALCRGACGPDCDPDNCTRIESWDCVTESGRNTGTKRRTVTEDCGVHQGCIEHDACYDDCNSTNGCGSWAAAFCRRSCDASATSTWGVSNGQSWARGFGPFERQEQFVFEDPTETEDHDECPPDDRPNTSRYPGRIYLAATPTGGGGDLTMGLHVIYPEDEAQHELVSPRSIDGVAVSPNGERLAVGMLQETGGDPQLAIFDTSEGAPITLLRSVFQLLPWHDGPQQLTGPAWVTDDLLVVSLVGDLHLYDFAEDRGSSKIWNGWRSSAAWGTYALVVETTEGLRGVIDVRQGAYADYDPWDIEGNVNVVVTEDPGRLWRVQDSETDWEKPKYSPDGSTVAFIDDSEPGVLRTIRVAASGAITDDLRFEGPGERIVAATFSPDGAFVAFAVGAVADSGGGLWVVENGNPLRVSPVRILSTDLSGLWHLDLAWGP